MVVVLKLEDVVDIVIVLVSDELVVNGLKYGSSRGRPGDDEARLEEVEEE